MIIIYSVSLTIAGFLLLGGIYYLGELLFGFEITMEKFLFSAIFMTLMLHFIDKFERIRDGNK